MLNEMEGRLGQKIDSGLLALRAEMSEMKSELRSEFRTELRSEIGSVKSEIAHLKSDLAYMKSEFAGMKSEFHRVALLVEEQNARNKVVLDGYAQLYELIERKLG